MPRFFQGPRCSNNIRLEGKVAVITGGNTGIGKETARELSKRGAEIVLACRDVDKAEKAAEEIIAETGGKVSALKLDLASLKSVKAAADELKNRHSRIHLLINNAGVMMCPQWTTEDGFEMQLGVNHLGHYLWTILLLDTVKQSAPSRIINLSSLAHKSGAIHFDDLMLQRSYTPLKSYSQSKLANILFTKELARRLEGTGVTALAVHPGLVDTELGRHLNQTISCCCLCCFNKIIKRFTFKTPEMGAQTTIYCATEESLVSHNGQYFSDCRIAQVAPQAEDADAANRLWQISEKLVNRIYNYGY